MSDIPDRGRVSIEDGADVQLVALRPGSNRIRFPSAITSMLALALVCLPAVDARAQFELRGTPSGIAPRTREATSLSVPRLKVPTMPIAVPVKDPAWSIRAAPPNFEARRGNPSRGQILINVSRGHTLDFKDSPATIFIADPSIADLQTPTEQKAFIFGKKPGRTSLFALDANGEAIAEYVIAVTQPIEELRNMLQSEIGDPGLDVTYTPGGAMLTGVLPNAGLVESAKSLTQAFIGPGGTVINRVRIAGAMQVNLQVRVAEVNRRVIKEFGVNLSARTGAGGFGFGIATGGDIASRSASSGGRVAFSYTDGLNSFIAAIDALAQDGLVTILAEPNLTALSGEKASFLAGGEFPIPISQALGVTSVQFRRFGASLEFEPTVLSSKLINLRVRPEVSELSDAGSVEFNGIRIPALSTRSADTVIELASGQSFAIGGLIRKNFSTSVGLIPGLGDLPVLGALFRSSSFQKDESELVIIVTPYLVRPGASPRSLELPTDRLAPPTDAGRVLLNTLAKSPSTRPIARKSYGPATGDIAASVH